MLKNAHIPTLPAHHAVEGAIWANLHKINGLTRATVDRVVVGPWQRQNDHSSRAGCEVAIRAKGACQHEIFLWGKRVEDAAATFQLVHDTYARLAYSGLAAQMPRPYFAVPEWGLIFMEKASGRPFRSTVLRHLISRVPSGRQHVEKTCHEIGGWLSRFHDALKLPECFDFRSLGEQIAGRLSADTRFSRRERLQIEEHVDRISMELKASGRAFHDVRLHNDFTLRNIIQARDGEFTVLDWDAMGHPEFLRTSSGWSDVTLFLLNLRSLARFEPVVQAARLRSVEQQFLAGYGGAAESGPLEQKTIQGVVYFFTLRFWLGIGVDRPLADIYSQRLGWRFIRSLRGQLALGPSALLAR